jgi:hypothetical protein
MKDETRWRLSSVDTITSLFKAVWWVAFEGRGCGKMCGGSGGGSDI